MLHSVTIEIRTFRLLPRQVGLFVRRCGHFSPSGVAAALRIVLDVLIWPLVFELFGAVCKYRISSLAACDDVT